MRSTGAFLGLLLTSSAVPGSVSASASPAIKDRTGRVVRQRTTETVQLYAYGTNISGLPIYAGTDNLAYLAADDAASNLTAVTWTIDATGTDAWTVAANTTSSSAASNSTSALTSGSAFYVVAGSTSDTDDSFAQAGFVADAASAPSGATTTGFVTYGPYVMVLSASDDGAASAGGKDTYVSEFWATASGTTDGVWTLMWNAAGTAQDNSVPVTLKTTAPITS